jgi:hypothetical protein
MAGLHVPPSTLHRRPHRCRRMTRGHRGSLLLRCRAFSSLSSRRFIPAHPTFRAEAADRARAASMPDTTWPISGHPPDLSRDPVDTPVSMSPTTFDTSSAVHLRSPSRSPPDAYSTPFPRTLTTRAVKLTQLGAVWHLPPQGDAEGPQSFISCTASLPSWPLPTSTSLSVFVAHLHSQIVVSLDRVAR